MWINYVAEERYHLLFKEYLKLGEPANGYRSGFFPGHHQAVFKRDKEKSYK